MIKRWRTKQGRVNQWVLFAQDYMFVTQCPLHIAKVEIGFLYPPVIGNILRLVAFHVLLHG